MTLHLNFPGSLGSRQAEQQQQQIREARKELKERVRNDWDYPTLPAHRSCGRRVSKANEKANAERVAGFRFHNAGNHDREEQTTAATAVLIELGFEPTEWRERIYSSGSDSDENSSYAVAASSKKGKQKTYKFDNPDSVGTQITERRTARKRRRQKALEEEMEWNDGLAHWLQRRDTWCCARTTAQVTALQDKSSTASSSSSSESAKNSNNNNEDSSSTHATDSSAASTASSSSSSSSSSASSTSPRNSTSGTQGSTTVATGNTSDPASSHSSQQTPISSPSTTPDLSQASTPPAKTATTTPISVLIPIAPPLLPNHPVRRRITPHLYPEIYSKVILQSRAPSVPINLATLIRALIQGWKDDGEWPPKTAPAEKAISRKKGAGGGGGGHDGGGGNGGGGSSLRQGVRAMGRVLRWSGVGEPGKGD